MKHYFKESIREFRVAEVSQEDWDYCAVNYMPSNPYKAFRSIQIMRLVHAGVPTKEIANKFELIPCTIRSTVLRGIHKMNERIYDLPESKLDRLLNEEKV